MSEELTRDAERVVRDWLCESQGDPETGGLRYGARVLLEQQAEEIERLRTELGYFHFADGVLSKPGMKGWAPHEDEPGTVNETGFTCGNGDWGCGTEECYSTKEKAAEAARAEQ